MLSPDSNGQAGVQGPSQMLKLYIVKTNGVQLVIDLPSDATVFDIGLALERRHGIPAVSSAFNFNGNVLLTGAKLETYSIKNACYVALHSVECPVMYLDPAQRAKSFDYDFTSIVDTQTHQRGLFPYKRPCGYKRFALAVSGKFENDEWLGTNESAWPCAYFGTGQNAAGSTLADVGWTNSKGCGTFEPPYVYYSCATVDAADPFATKFTFQGMEGHVLLQCRVHPSVICLQNDFFASEKESCIRPYGVCIRTKAAISEDLLIAALQSLESYVILLNKAKYDENNRVKTQLGLCKGAFNIMTCHNRLSVHGPTHQVPRMVRKVDDDAIVTLTIHWPKEVPKGSSCTTEHIGVVVSFDEASETYTLTGKRSDATSAQLVMASALDSIGPYHWTSKGMTPVLVQVPSDCAEFKEVADLWNETMATTPLLKVERVENRLQYMRFDQYKTIGASFPATKKLFHGTRATAPSVVYNSVQGFMRNYASDGMWGRACYFAKNASYSHSYCHTLSSKERQMFLVDVVVGKYKKNTPSNNGIKAPDVQPDLTPVRNYDCVQGVTGGSEVYMIYVDHGAYPSYLLTY